MYSIICKLIYSYTILDVKSYIFNEMTGEKIQHTTTIASDHAKNKHIPQQLANNFELVSCT